MYPISMTAKDPDHFDKKKKKRNLSSKESSKSHLRGIVRTSVVGAVLIYVDVQNLRGGV